MFSMLIQPYNPHWQKDFEALQEIIQSAFLGLDISIEHVGSTAVIGLAAKPIIDIDLVFPRNISFEIIKNRLEKIGYAHHGDQGIPQREVFKRTNSETPHPILDAITHHLYACPSDSEELQRHLLFRDYLKKNEMVRMEYEALKDQLAEEVQQDKKAYAALKELSAKAWIESIIERAKKER